MSISRYLFLTVFFVVSSTVAGQQERTQPSSISSPVVTASSSAELARFTAPGNITQMHLEVFSSTGEKVFDSGPRQGNVYDWRWQDEKALALNADNYLCVVTVRGLSGKTSRKLANLSFENQKVILKPVDVTQLNPVQTLGLGATDADTPLTIIDSEQAIAATVVAHDGNDGQVSRTRGALSFRLGNLFSGKDQEQMRLTEDGNLGIGTSKPEFKLDVAGTIRAERVLISKPNQSGVRNTSGLDSLQATNGNVQPLATGMGTQPHIAKWTDNSGTLGDSIANDDGNTFDVGGRLTLSGNKTLSTTLAPMLGLNTTINNTGLADSALQVRGATFNGPGDLPTGLDVAPTFAPNSNISSATGFVAAAYAAPPQGVTITDQSGGASSIVYSNTSGAVTNGTNFNIASPFVFGALKPTTQTGLRIRNQGISGTATSYGLYVDAQTGSANNYAAIFAGGRVGIGTTTPAAPLDVTGDVNTSTGYNIGGNRVLSTPGTNNLFAGFSAGQANTTGKFNVFVGPGAGQANDVATANSFFGYQAGQANTSGGSNSFFGASAGFSNTTGSSNAFFGQTAGLSNTTGQNNAFFGTFVGASNTTGSSNAFFGQSAGANNTTASNNSFFGAGAGSNNTTGDLNAFFGQSAGANSTTGGLNSFFGVEAGLSNTTGGSNSFFGEEAGLSNTTGSSNAFFGISAGVNNTTGFKNTAVGFQANFGSGNLDHATAIGADAVVVSSHTIVLGRTSEKVVVPGTMLVGQGLQSVPQMTVATIPLLPSVAAVCFNSAGDLLQCGGSSLRWKTNVRPFQNGLEIIRRLRPISFNWKEGGQPDIGLGAEDVAKVAPSLTLMNSKGESEGVKYDRLNIVLINAIKQQQQIERQQDQLKQQEDQIDALKKLICREHRKAAVCH